MKDYSWTRVLSGFFALTMTGLVVSAMVMFWGKPEILSYLMWYSGSTSTILTLYGAKSLTQKKLGEGILMGLIIEFLKTVPWKKVLPVIAVIGIICANFFIMFKLRTERDLAVAQRDTARARVIAAEQNYKQCKVNREAQEILLNEYSVASVAAAEQKKRLDNELAKASAIASRAVMAEAGLAEVTAKYNKLKELSAEATLCETYEIVLRALGGEEQ